MFRNKRFGVSKTRKALYFKNPFRSIGVVQPANHFMIGPMRRNGITSIEQNERMKSAKHLSELSNAGMVKQMKELGIIPDDMGVDMSEFTGNTAVLPQGVASLSDLEKQADVARQIQQFNAGILDKDQREQKALMKLAKKRKQSEYRQKIIQWLAETDELDEVPTEFSEEVENYYKKLNDAGAKKKAVLAARKKRKAKEDAEQLAQDLKRGYWQSNPFDRIVQPQQQSSVRYSTNTGLSQLPVKANDPDFEPSYLQPLFQDLGFGAINSGWRAPRLHKLLRPLKRFDIEETPDKIIEEQKQALDERRSTYQDEQKFQRGTLPPKNMIERAMPKLAEPFETTPQNLGVYGITLHPFIFPKKKYMMSTGLF